MNIIDEIKGAVISTREPGFLLVSTQDDTVKKIKAQIENHLVSSFSFSPSRRLDGDTLFGCRIIYTADINGWLVLGKCEYKTPYTDMVTAAALAIEKAEGPTQNG